MILSDDHPVTIINVPRPGRARQPAAAATLDSQTWAGNGGVAAVSEASHHPGSLPVTPPSSSPRERRLYISRRSSTWPAISSTLVLILIAIFLCAPAAAAHGDRQRSAAARLARRGTQPLVFDRREPPTPPGLRMLRGRKEASTSSSASATTIIRPPSSTADATTSAPNTITSDSSEATASPLPSPFDTAFGNNFTSQNCPTFFNEFLNNATFKACLPFSLLLRTSTSFFHASTSFVRITQTLDATCDVNFAQCNSLMEYLAQRIRSQDVCGSDYTAQEPNVIKAYTGFVAYQPLYQAGCLRDSKGNYCFANAVTNLSSPQDSYPYYLPLGNDLPGGSRPTCNVCLKQTMAVFEPFAGNASQPLSETYIPAAQMINMGCGPDFVNSTITSISAGGHQTPAAGGVVALLPLVLVGISLLW